MLPFLSYFMYLLSPILNFFSFSNSSYLHFLLSLLLTSLCFILSIFLSLPFLHCLLSFNFLCIYSSFLFFLPSSFYSVLCFTTFLLRYVTDFVTMNRSSHWPREMEPPRTINLIYCRRPPVAHCGKVVTTNRAITGNKRNSHIIQEPRENLFAQQSLSKVLSSGIECRVVAWLSMSSKRLYQNPS
jgi:hypothetical protein